MSKFSVVYVKQHPVMFGAIFLVFGLLLWMLLSRGASSSGNTTVTTPQPSDAAIAAGVALQQAQIGASTQVAMGQLSLAANQQNNDSQVTLATLALQAQMAQIQSDHDLNNTQIEASVGALSMQLANNLAITHDNNQFMIDYAKNAQDAATTQVQINAALSAQLSADQLKAYTVGSMLSAVGTVKAGDRDQVLMYVAGTINGDPNAAHAAWSEQTHGGTQGAGGGFNPLKILSPVAMVAGAVL